MKGASDNTTRPVVLADVQIKRVRTASPVVGHIVSNELCMYGKSASFVKHTVIDVSGTPLAGAFRAGQAFGVIPPGVDEHGKPLKVRLYSLACPSWGEDGKGNVISTTTKRLIDEFIPQTPDERSRAHHLFLGVCSNYMCDLLPGDEISLCGPAGSRFQLPADPSAHDYLFLATGTGIAPFRGMLKELLCGKAGAVPSQIHLVMGAAYTTDLLYHDLFQKLATVHPNFNYHTAISREARPEGQEGDKGETRQAGRKGLYVHQLVEQRLDEFSALIASPRTLIYVCGLAGMQWDVLRMLARHGLSQDYFIRTGALEKLAPEDWTDADIRRGARPTDRCLVEVY